MKVDVITRHSVANYGSILQSYATQKAIEKLNHKCEIIDYTRLDEQGKNKAKTLCKKSKMWNKNFLTRFLYYVIQTPNYLFSYNKFKKFRSKLLNQTATEYSSVEQLKNNLPDADVFCAGSDQIWGTIGNQPCDSAYFLDFVPKNFKCISYASSIGRDKISPEIEKNIKEFLPRFSSILVREKSAVNIIKNEGIDNVELVLDPTLLLSREEWNTLCKGISHKKKYVLVYQLHENKKLQKYAKRFAKKVGLPLVRICPTAQNLARGGKLVFLPTPQEFISYFRDAEYVVTDSFHGTVFSIIFNRKFIDILPDITSTRITNILSLLKLENRILNSYDDFSLVDKDIDYIKVNNILEINRSISIEKLKDAIECE